MVLSSRQQAQPTRGSRRLERCKTRMWIDDTLEKAMDVVANNGMKLRTTSRLF